MNNSIMQSFFTKVHSKNLIFNSYKICLQSKGTRDCKPSKAVVFLFVIVFINVNKYWFVIVQFIIKYVNIKRVEFI